MVKRHNNKKNAVAAHEIVPRVKCYTPDATRNKSICTHHQAECATERRKNREFQQRGVEAEGTSHRAAGKQCTNSTRSHRATRGARLKPTGGAKGRWVNIPLKGAHLNGDCGTATKKTFQSASRRPVSAGVCVCVWYKQSNEEKFSSFRLFHAFRPTSGRGSRVGRGCRMGI